MARPSGFTDALVGFARVLATGASVDAVMGELAARTRTVLSLAGAGVALVDDDGAMRFTARDGEDVEGLHRAQEIDGRGPCVDCVRTGAVVAEPDVTSLAARWPLFARAAAERGIRSVLAVPLRTDRPVGALDVYAEAPRDWPADDVAVAQALVDMAAAYLRGAWELARQRRAAQQLQEALDGRVVVEQAKGIVAAHRGVSIDTAAQILGEYAHRQHVSLRVVADAVVSSGLRP